MFSPLQLGFRARLGSKACPRPLALSLSDCCSQIFDEYCCTQHRIRMWCFRDTCMTNSRAQHAEHGCQLYSYDTQCAVHVGSMVFLILSGPWSSSSCRSHGTKRCVLHIREVLPHLFLLHQFLTFANMQHENNSQQQVF